MLACAACCVFLSSPFEEAAFFLTQTRFSLQKKKFALLPVQEQRDKNEMCTMELHSQEGVKKISDENYVGFCAFSFNNETS